jgi:hypothetical protein
LRAIRAAIVAALVVVAPAAAESYWLGVDVPARLGPNDYTPEQIVATSGGAYGTALTLPAGTPVGALHRRADGSWLFAPAQVVTLGGSTYEPRDVVAFDGANYTSFLRGSTVGIPSNARIDALLLDPAGRVIVSLDVPATILGTNYEPYDLLRYNSDFSVFWSGASSGVPATSNLCGAAMTASGALVLTFDTPTRLGGVDYLPGQLVVWNGGSSFSSYAMDPAWPPYAQLRDFAFLPTAGAVPDGRWVPGTGLVLAKSAGSIAMSWSASCSAGDTDYAIYEGSIGSFYDHRPRFCTNGHATTKTLIPGVGSVYYLVVPLNALAEGSYGRRSNGTQRPVSSSACLAQAAGSCP